MIGPSVRISTATRNVPASVAIDAGGDAAMPRLEIEAFDALVIGGGPAGLTCAIYLARYRRNVVVIDSRNSRAALIPETHNYPGFADGIAGPRLLDALTSQAKVYGVSIVHDRISSLQPSGAGFIATSSQAEVKAKRVVLATGLVDRNVRMSGLKEALGLGLVRYCPICDGFEASDLRIGVLGSADDAAAKALFLRTYSRQVTLLRLNDRAFSQQHVRELSEAGVRLPKAPVHAFCRKGKQMIASMRDGTQEVCDVIYPVLGCDVRSELGKRLGARYNDAGCLDVNAHQQTSVAGLYAIGDVVSDLHQIAVGTGHAALAATHLHNDLPRNFR
jgi:thioredoxin reductase (NADPH)